MQIIEHRINSISSLQKVSYDNGIELDIRYHNNTLVLHHDPFHHHENKPDTFEDLLKEYVKKHKGTIILNLKTEGIEMHCINLMNKYNWKNWFFLDLSMPYFVLYSKKAESKEINGFTPNNLAVRFSEYEPIEYAISFKNKASWVSVDCFNTIPLNKENYKILKNSNFKICLVAPELQKHNPTKTLEFQNILKYNNITIDAVCTKIIFMADMIKFPKINLNNVKGVMIDLDNTLYHYESCHHISMQKCYINFSNYHKISFEEFTLLYRKNRTLITQRLYSQGSCRSRLLAFQAMFENLNIPKSWELALKYDNLYWNTILQEMTISEDALSFLKQCNKLNIKTCIVSDMMCAIQIEKLIKLGVSKYINYLVTSEEVGFEKPNSIIFEKALEKLQLHAKDVIMIGDHEDKDIKGAEELGILAYKVLL